MAERRHQDCTPDPEGVLAQLRSADEDALVKALHRVCPCAAGFRVYERFRVEVRRLPGQYPRTHRGARRGRLAWTAVYQRCPQTDAERDRTLRSVHDSFEQAFRGFDTGRYPIWRDWLADAAAHPRRAGVIERMQQAGVLDLPGAREGW